MKTITTLSRVITIGTYLMLFAAMMAAPVTAMAQIIGIRSAVVQHGTTATIPVEISYDVFDVYGFQLDLNVSPSTGAPELTVQSIAKGDAVTTAPDVDSHPSLPSSTSLVRIGLPTEIPEPGEPRAGFSGPGSIVDITFAIPADAVAGQSYQLSLTEVILAGPGNQAIPVTVLGGTLTVGGATAATDTIAAPDPVTLNEGEVAALEFTVTGAGLPVPGVELLFAVDSREIAGIDAYRAISNADGRATIQVTGLRDGGTRVRVHAPALDEAVVAVSVNGVSPYITSTPPTAVAQGAAYAYDVEATDPQDPTGDSLRYILEDAPVGMTIAEATGLIAWPVAARPSPAESEVDVTVRVRDPENHSDSQTFSIYISFDGDADGYDDAVDCDDADESVNPGAAETPYDGVDNDCSPDTPDDDLDGDGYTQAADCDDYQPLVNPAAEEILYNVLDDDCNPATLDYVDNDGDGYPLHQTENYPKSTDCDDFDPNVNPGRSEILDNGVDDDCSPGTADTWGDSFVVVTDDDGNIYRAGNNDSWGMGVSFQFLLEPVHLQTGEVRVDQNWTHLNFKTPFLDPVVVATTPGYDSNHPALARIRNVTRTGFDIRIQEWDYQDGIHPFETVGYVVVEQGRYTLPDGTLLEAGTFETGQTEAFGPVAFSEPFNEVPVVVAGVTSLNEPTAVTGRIRNIGTDGFEFLLQEQEASAPDHPEETVSFIAWEPSAGAINGLTFEVVRTGSVVTDSFRTIAFDSPFVDAPALIATMQTAFGPEPAGLRWLDKNKDQVRMQVDEEQSADSETDHPAESVGYMIFSVSPGGLRSTGGIGQDSRGVAVADFNNDSHLDMIVGGGLSGRVDYHLFLDDAEGQFARQGVVVSHPVSGRWAMGMTAGDIDNDGNMDFIGDTDSEAVIVALGDGTGRFESYVIDFGERGRGCDLADFNGDGILDLARGSYSDGYIQVYPGNGDGSFEPAAFLEDVGDNPYGVAAADFDNDGLADIIANSGAGGDPYFFRGNGDGTFDSGVYVASLDFDNYGSYDAYHLNSDRHVDIVAVDYTGRQVWFYPGNGDGTFGLRMLVGKTSRATLGVSAPPYRPPGTPYAKVLPETQSIPLGQSAEFDGSGSKAGDPSGTIVSWEWDFGDGTTGSGESVSHTYSAEGTYLVNLTVTDDRGMVAIGAADIMVRGDPPVAVSGGPYTFGEAFADHGTYTFSLDGSGSTDDSGIEAYAWQVNFLHDGFAGTEIDASKWIASTGVSQDDKIAVSGAGEWDTRYLFSQADFYRIEGLTFHARILPVNTAGDQWGMFGFKHADAGFGYAQMSYAVYFKNGEISIYEDGNSRGIKDYYTRNEAYEIRITLKSTGASYYLRKDGDTIWSLIYDSTHSNSMELNAGMTIKHGTFELDDADVSRTLEGSAPSLALRQGVYPIFFTVTDESGQQDRDDTVIQVVPNDPPMPDPGGPYLVDETGASNGEWPIIFDGSASSDDYGILRYEWDFDASDGVQVDATGETPIHVYTAPGTYTVTLTVTDHALQSRSMTTTVTLVTSDPPAADPGGPYTVNEDSAEAGLWTVVFDGSGSSDGEGIAAYVWDFGDGNTLTSWYAKERYNFFEAGTRLYGYDLPDANLRIIATQDNTRVNIVNLATGSVTGSNILDQYEEWTDCAPGDGIYFKVEADKPVVAYATDGEKHATFVPSLDSGPVGREFIFRLYPSDGFYIFAIEEAIVRVFETDGTQVAEAALAAGAYWDPGLSGNIYHVLATGTIAMQNAGGNGYTTAPAVSGSAAGTLFYCATHGEGTGALAAFAYEDADVSVHDMDTGDLLWTRRILQGEYWWQTDVGARRLRIESTADIEVWAGDTELETGIEYLGDDASFTGGKDGKVFYAHGLMEGLVIFAPFDDTAVAVNDLEQTLAADDYLRIPGGDFYHITASKPVVVQTLGRAGAYNNLGTYLGGISEVYHEYGETGDYDLTLTVYDRAGQPDTVSTTVSVARGAPPVAVHGGPYVIGEASARDGEYIVSFDGRGSSDDFGIYLYEWDFGHLYEDGFSGNTLNEERLDVSEAVTQDEMITISGNGDWGERYCFSQKSFKREANVFTGRLRARSGGRPKIMWGLKNNSIDYGYTHMPYAIYFREGDIRIFEGGTNRGSFGRHEYDQWYDLKIELKPVRGARYWYKPADETDWILLYDSNHATRATLFKVGCTANSGTHDMDDVRVRAVGHGSATTHIYDAPGTYSIGLKVTDHALQTDSGSTTLTIAAGEPPVADAGGPYTGEPYSFVSIDGGGSTDDNRIARYVWDFGDGHTGEGVRPGHFYREAGTYEVTLTVFDNLLQSDTDQTTVTVTTGEPPVADAGGPYTGGVGGPPVFFDGTASSDDHGIVTYEWDLSEGWSDDFEDGDDEGWTATSGSWVVEGGGYRQSDPTLDRAMALKGNAEAGDFTVEVDVRLAGGSGQMAMIVFRAPDDRNRYEFVLRGRGENDVRLARVVNGNWRMLVDHDLPFTVVLDTVYHLKAEINGSTIKLYLNDDLVIQQDDTLLARGQVGLATYRTDAFFDNFIFIDAASKGYGASPTHTYSFAGDHMVTLTVEDGAGQVSADTAVVHIEENLPPRVICVPWVGTDLKFPHETWNGKEITLKGVVKDSDPRYFQWDFGDGTSSPKESVSKPYDLSVKHIYPHAPEFTPFIATLTVWDSLGQTGTDTYKVVVKDKALDIEINVAIDEALWFLHKTQDRSGGASDGSWSYNHSGSGIFRASPTASALHAFQINTHSESGNPDENPYVETVSRGLRYLLTTIRSQDIDPQTYGDPDTNANGIGIEVASSLPVYELGMVMMAIAATGTPLAVAHTGGVDIHGRFYHDILSDMVDMYAWGQTDWTSNGGGWRYSWNSSSDNSVNQWAALGMEAAEEMFSIPVPEWVKERNQVWLLDSENDARWGYLGPQPQGSGGFVATTPAGLAQLAFDDVSTSDFRWINAQNFIASIWDSWYLDTSNYYALYGIAKALRIAVPREVTAIGEDTPWAVDWFKDAKRGVARTVLDDQMPEGWFCGLEICGDAEAQVTSWIHDEDTFKPFRTAWGVIILSQTLFVKPPVADAGPDRVYGIDLELSLDGSGSYHTDPFRSIVLYEWDVNGDGIYDYTGGTPTVKHTYSELGVYTVTLRVTDDNVPEKTDTDTAVITITAAAHPPIAVPGGPYTARAGMGETLDGSGSYDIDPADAIARYGWELDGEYPYDFDDAEGPNPVYVWSLPGFYNVGLKVWDNGVMNDLDGDGEVDENERLTDIQWTTVLVAANNAPVADANGPYAAVEGGLVTLDGTGSFDPDGDSITLVWDLDGDGVYDDAAGATPAVTFDSDGSHTIYLKVSGGGLDDTDTAVVVVTDFGPTAAFNWSPEPQDEGLALAFTDRSTSPVDVIVDWLWDFGGLGSSTDQNPTFTFSDNGIYTVTLTVTDEDGSAATASMQVTVDDLGPTAAFTWTPEPQNEGSAVSFTDASSSSPDTIISWSWDFDGLGTSSIQNPGFTFADNGTYNVTLIVTDDDGSTNTVSQTITVTDVGPAAALTGDATLDEGQAGSYDAGGSTSSPDGIVSYEWDWNYDGITFSPSGDTGAAQTHTWMDNGAYTVAVRVTDDDGSMDMAGMQVTVNDRGPAAAITGDTPIDEGRVGNFDAGGSSSSPDDMVSYEWDWNYDGITFTPSGDTGAAQTHTWMDNGAYTAAVRVTDDDGSTDTAGMQVTVKDFGPTAAFTWAPEPQVEGAVVNFTDQSGSPVDDIVGWAWDFGALGSSTEQNPGFTFNDNGVFIVILTVTDEDGSTDTVRHPVNITDKAPLANMTGDTPIEEGQAGSFDASGSSSSPDYIVLCEWDWEYDGTFTPSGDTGVTHTHSWSSSGGYIVAVRVTDEDGSTDIATLAVTVSPRSPILSQCIFDLTARPKSGKVQTVWTHEIDAECYDVYRSTSPDVELLPGNRIANCHVTTYATYLDTSVVNNTTYYYRVVKLVNGIEICYSNEVGATPTARRRTR